MVKICNFDLIKYGNDTNNFQFAILDYNDNNSEYDKIICICQFEKKYEESKYGPLILLFSNAISCKYYNKIFGNIKNIGIFSSEKEEKLQEWPRFPQYSNFDRIDNEEKDGGNQSSDVNCSNTIESNSNPYPSLEKKKEQIEKFFASENGQEEYQTLEDSRSLA